MNTGIINLEELCGEMEDEFDSMAERKLEKYIIQMDNDEDEE